jgi:hypothetical protein
MATAVPELDQSLATTTEELRFLQSVMEHWTNAEAHATMAEELVLQRQQRNHQEAIGTQLRTMTEDHDISTKIKAFKKRVRAEIKAKRKDLRELVRARRTLRKLALAAGAISSR